MAGKCPNNLERAFVADSEVLTVSELCQKYDRAPSTIKDWRLRLYEENKLLWWPGISTYPVTVYDDFITVEGDAIIVSDLEVPYHDAVLLGYAVALAQRFEIKRLIIAGDFVANNSLGFYASRSEDTDAQTTLADTLVEGKGVLEGLAEGFTEILLIKGNHEQRGTQMKELGFFKLMQ